MHWKRERWGLTALLLAACLAVPVLLWWIHPWGQSGLADGFQAADEDMRRMLEEEGGQGASAVKGKGEAPAGKPLASGSAPAQKEKPPSAATDKGAGAPAAGAEAEAGATSRQNAAGGKADAAGPSGNAAPRPAAPRPAAAAADGTAQDAAPAAAKAPAKAPAASGRLPLNTATAKQLEALPGIGASRAAAIVELREQLGGSFHSLDQLLEVKGIGEKTLQKLKPLLELSP